MIVDTLVDAFSDLMRADPAAFRTKFRKMAADPFAFYRGAARACSTPTWRAARTRGPTAGRAGCGSRRPARGELRHVHGRRRRPDLRRQRLRRGLRRALHVGRDAVRGEPRAAGVAQGAVGRGDLALVARYCHAYLDQVRWFAEHEGDRRFALRLDTTDGPVHRVLQEAKLHTRVDLLDEITEIEGDGAGAARGRGPAPARRRRARVGAGRVRPLPGDDPGGEAFAPGDVHGEGRGGQVGFRHRQRGGCPRTRCWWRATTRRWTTTSCCR